MKRKQILALAIAIAFTAQPQIANAAEPEGQSEVNIEAAENDSEETEVTEGTEDTELIFPQIKELSGIVKAAGTDGGVVDGKLATVRVTNTDVYGIVGGKASLVGNYDQGQPAVPKDGIAWCYGDKTKVVADANKYGNPESTTMTLRNIEASQDGQTFCLSATNEVGTAYSPLVTLHVLDAKSENQTALTDEDVTLAVETTGDWGSYVKYQWYKGTQKISGATKAALTLENVTLEDAGEYRCIVQKGFGRADEYNSKTVDVTLEVKERILDTKITSSHDGKAVKKGTKVSFKAEAIGDWGDELSYQWYDKDGKPIADQEPYAGATTDTLTVTAQNSLDGMGYYCVITGAYGSTQTETSTLNVKAEDSSNKDDKNVSTKKDTTKKTESKTNPVKTGDSAQTGLWAVIAGLGLIEILEILKNKVKR